jgi:membrane associated rhomboid family serine protease
MSQPTGGPAPVQAEPVCPRHPDRVSYVRCQRCERPTCPECQRPAAVGVQCVDCVREQARQTRSVRTVFGGTARQGRPVVTFTIIGLCVAVFLGQLAPGSTLTQQLAFAPFLAESQPYRFLTAAFLHSTSFLPHIAFNMLALYQVGPFLEAALGRVRFVALYLLSAVGGSVGYLVLADRANPFSWSVAVVGASGAVFGLFGALVVVQRRLGLNHQGVLLTIGLNFVLGFVIAGIAWQSHLGGLVTGAAIAFALALPPRGPRRALLQAGGVAAVAVVLLAATLVKLHLL